MDIKKKINEFEVYLKDLGCCIENQNEPERSKTKDKIIAIRKVIRMLNNIEKGEFGNE